MPRKLKYFIVLLLLIVLFVSKTDANDLYFSTSDKNYSSHIVSDGGYLKYGCWYTTKVYSSGSEGYNSFWYAIKKSDNISWNNIRENTSLTNKNSYFVLLRNGYPNYFYISLSYKSLLTRTDLGFVDIQCNSWNLCQLSFTGDPSGQDTNGMKNNTTPIPLYIHDVSYNTYAYPCRADVDGPKIVNNNWLSTSKIEGQSGFKFLTYDWSGTNKVDYWFSGYDYSVTGLHYESASSKGVDNQNGVNSGTIKVVLTCTGCEGSSWISNNGIIVLTGGSNGYRLSISDWNGSPNDKNALTWNSKRRGYNVSFTGPEYEVEKPVNVYITVDDNPTFDPYSTVNGHSGSTHRGVSNITFNNPVPPELALSGEYVQISPDKSNSIVVDLSDDWAGINTGSLNIWVSYSYSGINSETQEEILIDTGYTISSTSGTFDLYSGGVGKGEAGCYAFTFNPIEDFPTDSTITITGYVLDKAGNTGYLTDGVITTRSPCSAYGCVDLFYMWNQGFDGGKLSFTGGVVQITGNRLESGYPRFEKVGESCNLETGEGCEEILMCGKDWSYVNVTGSVEIDGLYQDGEDLKYTGSVLYITGLNFEINDDGIIVVLDD